MKTVQIKPNEITRNWHIIDAQGMRLGKVATSVANLLRGKNKVIYTPNVDCGDHVVVINSEKLDFTTNKLENKSLYSHSGFPGGLTEKTYKELVESNPNRIVEHAVKGMLPKNKLAGVQIRRLRVYKNADHNHSAQKPTAFEYKKIVQK